MTVSHVLLFLGPKREVMTLENAGRWTSVEGDVTTCPMSTVLDVGCRADEEVVSSERHGNESPREESPRNLLIGSNMNKTLRKGIPRV